MKNLSLILVCATFFFQCVFDRDHDWPDDDSGEEHTGCADAPADYYLDVALDADDLHLRDEMDVQDESDLLVDPDLDVDLDADDLSLPDETDVRDIQEESDALVDMTMDLVADLEDVNHQDELDIQDEADVYDILDSQDVIADSDVDLEWEYCEARGAGFTFVGSAREILRVGGTELDLVGDECMTIDILITSGQGFNPCTEMFRSDLTGVYMRPLTGWWSLSTGERLDWCIDNIECINYAGERNPAEQTASEADCVCPQDL
ncbi:MAG: hypothetical protein ABH826_01335 [Patescibacteria group bacterium]